jgi:hypothetical protein
VTKTGTSDPNEQFTWDKNGNRVTSGQAASLVNYATAAYNRVTDDGTYTYQYDGEGNRTRRENKVRPDVGDATSVWFEAYAWDHRQRLTSVTRYNRDGGTLGTVKYQYDGLDRRIRRTEVNGSGTVTKQERFLYERHIMADADASSLLPRHSRGAPGLVKTRPGIQCDCLDPRLREDDRGTRFFLLRSQADATAI